MLCVEVLCIKPSGTHVLSTAPVQGRVEGSVGPTSLPGLPQLSHS